MRCQRQIAAVLEAPEKRRENECETGDRNMIYSLVALILGYGLDLLLGDPSWLYHPVRIIGNLISFLERHLNDGNPAYRKKNRNPRNEFLWGIVMVVLVLILSSGAVYFLIWGAGCLHPLAGMAVETFFCWQLLATRSLKDESMKVYDRLRVHDLEGSRKAVSMIVGRDTENLDEAGVTKAAVETVAENTSDGVVAPLFFMAIGGAPLGFFYKAVNTMDSMVGYKNDRYLYFGRFAARLDDVVNFIPARLSALCMLGAAFLLKMNGSHCWEVYKRDRKNHASPNSAQTEAVAAGALNVQLAGDAWYFGKRYEKPTIGDDHRPVKPTDILRVNRLMYVTSLISLGVMIILKCLIMALV